MSVELPSGTTAGIYARNEAMQTVAADDLTRVGKHKTCIYSCYCGCGYRVYLKRGPVNRPHFAYAADHVSSCKGSSGCRESKEHYDAKWLLYERFGDLCFWETCPGGHRTTSSKYCRESWTATVEKIIPGTTYRADVLLENNLTGASVALEVVHSSQVTKAKKTACDTQGTPLFEVSDKGLTAAVDSRLFQIENTIPSARGFHDCALCELRIRRETLEAQKDKEAAETRRIEDEQCRIQQRQMQVERQRAQQLAHQEALEEAAREKLLNERRRGEFHAEVELLAKRRRDEADQLQRHKQKVFAGMYELDSKRRRIERRDEIVKMNLAACHSKYA